MDRNIGDMFVEQGSIYNPGWLVTECIGERHFSVWSTHDTELEAQESLGFNLAYYTEEAMA